ncbi:hypothetical protein ACW9KT_15670 [Hymenobacter sp. HD11105]
MYPNEYDFELGSAVRFPENAKRWYKVIWRGKVKLHTGAFAYVYQLDDNHWDCYYADELWDMRVGKQLVYAPR